jgi:2-polyprenyl-3-methyl-5-hydroxy-6-metoxy-1,4-benzoquinol methylase
MAVSNDLAECIFKLAAHVPGGIDELCRDYRFLCEDIVVPEEIHFRRHGGYRLSSFEEANRECYANAPFMARYMNGLLLSDVLWANHAAAFASFVNDYLPLVADQADHLEIGPGHGLFLYFAARSARVAKVSGWDVSPTSIAATRGALVTLGSPKTAELTLQNLFEAPPADGARLFDSIVMSEILEHLEDPVAALQAAAKYLKLGGTLFVNVPANSPAPDHIFLFNGLDHAVEIVERAGLTVIENKEFPMSGATLERARKHKLSISCVVIARKD